MEKADQIHELSELLAPFFHDPIDDPCPYCEAAEALYAAGYRKLPMVDCPKCGGTGNSKHYESRGKGDFDEVIDMCEPCHGSGRLPERPRVLSDEVIQEWAERFVNPNLAPYSLNDFLQQFAQVALADAIRHYEGMKDA